MLALSVSLMVGLCSQEQVLTKERPRMRLTIFMNNIAEGLVGHALCIDELAVEVAHDLVADTGGTIVIKEVVEIRTILGLTIVDKRLKEASGFALAKIENLLSHKTAAVGILCQKVQSKGGTNFILAIATHKAPTEIGCIEGE